MKYDILLATNNRNLETFFKKSAAMARVRLDMVKSPARLNKIFRKRGKSLEVMILDLTLPDKDLNRFIFYIKQYKKELPVFLLRVDHSLVEESEAFRNLSIYGCIRQPSTKEEAEEILEDLNNIFDLDMNKKLEKIEYLEQERVFSCTFKSRKTFFLKREDVPDDDGTKIKHYSIDEDKYYFTVYLESGKEYEVPWDFIRAMCDEKYEHYRDERVERISSEEIGKRIKQARRSKKLKQEDMSAKTGILRANISRIESGKHYPSLNTLEKIAEALEFPVAKFLIKR